MFCESNAIYSIGMALVVLGCLLLAVFSSEYIPGYRYSQDFSAITCTIQSSMSVGNVCCEASVKNIGDCDEDYVYPCVLITTSMDGSDQSAIFYDDFVSAAYGGRIMDCSYFHCDSSSYEERLEDVTKFNDSHQPGTSLSCHHGKDNDVDVALETVVSQDTVVASVIVSIIILLAGIIICVVMYVIGRVTHNPDDVEKIPPSEENLKGGDEFDEDSEIETIEMNTTTTSVSARSGRSTETNKSGAPPKRQQSFVAAPHK